MTSAKSNIAKLPEFCYGMLLTDLSLIAIKAGESGFYPRKMENPSDEDLGVISRAEREIAMDKYVDELNARKGISRGVREAMEWGSQFGWEIELANPDYYDADGVPKDKKK